MITKEDAGSLLKAILKHDYTTIIDKLIEGEFFFMHFDVEKQRFDDLTFKDIVKAYYGLEEPNSHLIK